jgi:hypothetical protein
MGDTERTFVDSEVRNGREYAKSSDGSEWTRKVMIDPVTGKAIIDPVTGKVIGISEWRKVEAPPDEDSTPSTRHLSLVLQNQLHGEPDHWSLFAHYPDAMGNGTGQVWQVKGDPEFMRYMPRSNVDILNSGSYKGIVILNENLSDAQYAKVDQIARTEPPPRADRHGAVTENCQGWTIRVLWRLADEGIVKEAMVSKLEKDMDPIKL